MTRERFSFGHKPIFKTPLEGSEHAYGRPAKGAAQSEDFDIPYDLQPEEIVVPLQTAAVSDFPPKHQANLLKPGAKGWSLKRRIAALLGVIAIPAMAAAAPDDFGQLPGGAPTEAEMVRERLQAELKRNPAMPFERPGMSFPGSAFFFLAEPPRDALIALPELDALAEGIGEAGRELGTVIDAGPGANPFFASGGTSQVRAQSCLAQAIWYEAANESEAGQRAVAQVVLNRVAHPNWPSSVCGVVYQGSSRRTGCQFTFTCDGSLRRKAGGSSWSRAQRLAEEALGGSVYDPIGHATHYHTLWVNPYWASSLDHVGTIGAHRFYRNRGAGGRKDAFTQSYAGVEPGVNTHGAGATRGGNDALPDLPLPTGAEFAPSQAQSEASSPASTRRATQAPVPALTGPGAVLVQPEVAGAGQVRQDYSRAGQWKDDAARAALLEDQQRRARENFEQGAPPPPGEGQLPR